MNLKVTCHWANSEHITRRLLDQFKTDDVDVTHINFVNDDSYDVIIYFGYVSEPIKLGACGYLFPQEPTWTGGHQKTFNNMPNLTVYGFERHNYSGDAKFVEAAAHMFYGGVGPTGEGWDNWTFKNISNLNPIKSKNICSTISNRGDGWEGLSPDCLYPQRCNLVKQLLHLDYIDFFGGWTNERPNVKGYPSYKYDAILPYKFILTIENSNENWYVSEKFFDPILVNAIPIYFGCRNIRNLIPEHGYIHLGDITDADLIIKKLDYINSDADALYEQMLPEVLKIKQRYFDEFNPLKNILKLLNNK